MRKVGYFLILLLLVSSACSSISDKELFDSAKKKITEQKYSEALKDFQKIVDEYPESKYYIESLFEIGKMYHGKVVKNISSEESFKKAIGYYKKVFEKDPDGPYSQKSLFMIGFIQANELHQFEEAKKSYNLFIQKYPESELTAAAKAELDNLGIPPEEILKKNGDIDEK